jgi:hypothetical protein
MKVLGPIVQVPLLSVSKARHHDPFRGGIAAQLVVTITLGPNPRGSLQLAEKSMAANRSRL